jgi:capsular exopolysaccharide synthesis family protein
VTVESVFSFLRRRWIALAVCVLAGALGGFAQAKAQHKVYTSDARLFVNIPAARDTQEALQGVQLSSDLIQSYATIVKSRSVAEQIKTRLGLPASFSLDGKISATQQPNTLILAIGASDQDPARAQSIAQAAATVLNDKIGELEHDRTPASAVEASIVDNATRPTSPSSPKPLRNTLLGLFLGLVAGLAISLLLDALDRSVKSAAVIEPLVGAPPLAVVPQVRDVKSALLTGGTRARRAAEAYRSLRTSLRFIDPDNPVRTLLVTSPDDGDGKTTTAANLAIALAQDGQRVILVDADLRKAGLSKLLNVGKGVGLTDVITGHAELESALQDHRDLFAVLPAGPLPPNPSEMLGSERMAVILEQLAERADIVVIDAAPVLPVTDAVVLSAVVDGTALVVRHAHSERGAVAESGRRLNGVGAHLVGFVFNGAPRPSEDYSAAPATAPASVRVLVPEL